VAPRLRAAALAPFERDGLKAVLKQLKLPLDVAAPAVLFWRFETESDVPVGFGALEICGRSALLCAVVTLPPLRRIGFGRAIVAALEQKAQMHGARAIYLATATERTFFAGLGYAPCKPGAVPVAIKSSAQYAALTRARVAVMVKRVG
jgi:N-acetylglutamate synthase-like GNAT family acetyltransferase